MDYINEHLLPGQLGHFFVILSLAASLVATFAYFKATTAKGDTGYWKKLARYAFIIETVSVVAIFSILFYIIYNHLFEYKYAWQHSSLSLEFKYMLACFWEGQEGAFLLWSFWHCVLGLILIKTSKQWEAPVMTVISFAQLCLATMIAGIYIFDWKMGSSPFTLLRDSGVLDNPGSAFLHINADINQPLKEDYMLSITDGNDLNILLQNYWMVIHPPVLFLGFSSTIVPFAYAVGGLWTKKFGEWTKPALPWSLFSAAVFGVGIMMGAAWAYESLSFGGYWAWDPVENASLVPWLILISGIHTILIYNHSGHSLRATHLFMILTYAFVLYSTFLTRSGVLGDSSVHAFTDLGMNVQLYMLLYVFFWIPPFLAAKNNKQKLITGITGITLLGITFISSLSFVNAAAVFGFGTLITGIGFIIYQIQTQVPTIHKEESSSSREFWMFIGSLVFFLSAIVIIGKTSLPILNAILSGLYELFPSIKGFNKKIAAPEDQEFAYNQIQIFVAIIIATLTGFAQYLKYKGTTIKFFWKKIWLPTLIAVVIASMVIIFGKIKYDQQGPMFVGAIWLAVTCSIYTVIANATYIWVGMKGKLNLSGGSVAHFGFGLVLIGILISSANKEVLSYNTSGIFFDFGKDSKEKAGENLTLVKGIKNDMGKYWVTYEGPEKLAKKDKWAYHIRFEKKDSSEKFLLSPIAYIRVKGRDGISSEPDSRHYLGHDVFTYITALPDNEKNKDTAKFKPHTIKPGDTVFYSRGYMILQDLKIRDRDSVPDHIAKTLGPKGAIYEAPLKFYSKTGSIYSRSPKLVHLNNDSIMVPDTVTAEGLIVQLQKANPDKTIELGVKQSENVMDFITLKAYKFPLINVLWAGIIITAIGILISMVRRIQLNRSGKD